MVEVRILRVGKKRLQGEEQEEAVEDLPVEGRVRAVEGIEGGVVESQQAAGRLVWETGMAAFSLTLYSS